MKGLAADQRNWYKTHLLCDNTRHANCIQYLPTNCNRNLFHFWEFLQCWLQKYFLLQFSLSFNRTNIHYNAIWVLWYLSLPLSLTGWFTILIILCMLFTYVFVSLFFLSLCHCWSSVLCDHYLCICVSFEKLSLLAILIVHSFG